MFTKKLAILGATVTMAFSVATYADVDPALADYEKVRFIVEHRGRPL